MAIEPETGFVVNDGDAKKEATFIEVLGTEDPMYSMRPIGEEVKAYFQDEVQLKPTNE